MELRGSDIDGTQKPPPVEEAAEPSFSRSPSRTPRTLNGWGSTGRRRCQLVSDHRDPNDRRPSSAFPSPPPTLHQSENDPSPSSGCFSVPLKNPTLRWGSTRRMRCQLVSDHRDHTDRPPSSASPPPLPTSHETKNDPTPSSGRPRLVIRIPRRTQPKDPERDGPRAPEEWQDHHQETKEADGGDAPLEIARHVACPLRRSLRSRAGTQIEEKTGKKMRPAEFSISLSKEEIMEDFIAMTGGKPPRRPKKRPKSLQDNLNVRGSNFWRRLIKLLAFFFFF